MFLKVGSGGVTKNVGLLFIDVTGNQSGGLVGGRPRPRHSNQRLPGYRDLRPVRERRRREQDHRRASALHIGYTGIYEDWNVDSGGDPGGDDPWRFRNTDQYPILYWQKLPAQTSGLNAAGATP